MPSISQMGSAQLQRRIQLEQSREALKAAGAEFGECRQIDDPTVIADILSQLHIESAPVLEAARAETNKAALGTQTGEAEQLGIFGAPSFTTADGELVWGNDRLGGAIAWAKKGR